MVPVLIQYASIACWMITSDTMLKLTGCLSSLFLFVPIILLSFFGTSLTDDSKGGVDSSLSASGSSVSTAHCSEN